MYLAGAFTRLERAQRKFAAHQREVEFQNKLIVTLAYKRIVSSKDPLLLAQLKKIQDSYVRQLNNLKYELSEELQLIDAEDAQDRSF
jgi:hypothetical protein